MATANQVCWLCGDFSECFSTTGTTLVQATTTRIGEAYALRCNPTTTATGFVQISGVSATGVLAGASVVTSFIRFYFLANTLPASGDEAIAAVIGTTAKLTLRINSSGKLVLYLATGTLIATGTTTLLTGTWYGIQIQCGTSSSTVEVQLAQPNGAFASEIGPTTSSVANINTTSVRLGKVANVNGNTVDFFYSDLLWSSTAYPGHGQSAIMKPASNGSNTSGVANGAATLWQCLNQIPSDGDTTYVDTLIATQSYTANMTASGASGTINTVKPFVLSRNLGAGGSAQQTVLSGATTKNTTSVAATTSYAFYGQILDVDPNTSSAWTVSNLDAVQCGFTEGVAGNRWTGAFVTVDYLAGAAPTVIEDDPLIYQSRTLWRGKPDERRIARLAAQNDHWRRGR